MIDKKHPRYIKGYQDGLENHWDHDHSLDGTWRVDSEYNNGFYDGKKKRDGEILAKYFPDFLTEFEVLCKKHQVTIDYDPYEGHSFAIQDASIESLVRD